MRLRRFEVKNFKALQDVSIDWEELLVLIGENNSGKSCLLLALSHFLSGSAIKDRLLFHRFETGPDHSIEFIGHFDQLTDAEKDETAVQGRMNGGEWILIKKYWLEAAGDSDEGQKESWKEQLFSYSSPEVFTGWPSPDTTWASFPTDYQPLIEQLPNQPARPNNAERDALRALVRREHSQLVTQGQAEWIPNPGGGGNWKSNANSIIPRAIYVRAVHEASDETNAKDASSYGKLINLIIERQLSERAEVGQLKTALARVMQLFRPDDAHPEQQADEIRALEQKITSALNAVISGEARIKTEPPDLNQMLMPSTSLVIRDPKLGIETEVTHQGHGLQRTLVMTLLQLLAEIQGQTAGQQTGRPTVLIIEEPELYMHPQMERRMRDVLYQLSSNPNMQVVCSTHSPVFLDIAEKYRSIVRFQKDETGHVDARQVNQDIFAGPTNQAEKEKLQTVARFNPAVNELFFANRVVVFEEFSAIAALERAAELTGIFARYPELRREITAIDCDGKTNIPAFQRVLNAFSIPYRVIHDEDRSQPGQLAHNARIAGLATQANPPAATHLVSPENLESMLGYQTRKNKPYVAVKKVEELYAGGTLPEEFIQAMNFVYFGRLTEAETPAAGPAVASN